MNRLPPAAILALVALVAWAAIFAMPVPHNVVVGLAGGFLTAIAIMWAGTAGSGGVPRGLNDAIRRAAAGERPATPADAPPELLAVYDEIGRVADAARTLNDEAQKAKTEIASAREDSRKLLGEAESKRDAAREELRELKDELRRMQDDLHRAQSELARERESSGNARTDASRRRTELEDLTTKLEEQNRRLQETIQGELAVAEEAGRRVRDVTSALKDIAQNVETLASSAEESSSSILELTATNDEVAENVGELAASVRETVSSIEEMTYSIKEVAKNVDALSLTAEETSSSMNEMDVSIDQVQSNANETAKLSEEVASDAERGAEAILKTIGEIYRIKESSQEAVAVMEYFGCEDIEDIMIRRKKINTKDRSKRREFDVIAVCEDKIILNETKVTPRTAYIDDFAGFLERGEFFDYFPEYEGKVIIPIFASLYIDDDSVRYLSKKKIYALGMKDDTMEILNPEF